MTSIQALLKRPSPPGSTQKKRHNKIMQLKLCFYELLDDQEEKLLGLGYYPTGALHGMEERRQRKSALRSHIVSLIGTQSGTVEEREENLIKVYRIVEAREACITALGYYGMEEKLKIVRGKVVAWPAELIS